MLLPKKMYRLDASCDRCSKKDALIKKTVEYVRLDKTNLFPTLLYTN